MLTGWPAVRLTLPDMVVGGWSRKLLMICWPLMNSRLPSSLVRLKVKLPVVGGVSVPVHLADHDVPGTPGSGGWPPHRKLTFGSFCVTTGVPENVVLLKYWPVNPVPLPDDGFRNDVSTIDPLGDATPWEKVTLAFPARVLMPWNGVMTDASVDGLTCVLPPPAVIASAPASSPITATDVEPATGSTALFFNSTLPSSAVCVATAWCADEVTVAPIVPVWGLSNRPWANIAVSIRRTWSSIVAWETWPAFTAAISGSPKNVLPVISWSRPLLAAFTVECVPPKSDPTKPVKPSSPLRIVFSRSPFSQASVPLTVAYEHITALALPCWTADTKAGR